MSLRAARPLRRAAALASCALLAGGLLGACGSESTDSAAGAAGLATSTTAAAPSSAPEQAASADCVTTTLSQALGTVATTQRVGTSTSGVDYRFSLAEDQFDACQDLSWAVFAGSFRTVADQRVLDSYGKGGGATVVFFQHGQPVADPAPQVLDTVVKVERVSDSAAQITWQHGSATGETSLDSAGAEGSNGTEAPAYEGTPLPASTTLDLAALATGDASATTSAPTATAANSSAASSSPSATAAATEASSSTSSPATSSAEGYAAGRYRVPIADNQNLLCEFEPADDPDTVADCWADFPVTWKMNDAEHRQATRVRYSTNPDELRASNEPAPSSSGYAPLEGGGVQQVGAVTVDLTHPHEAYISRGGENAAKLTPDSYEVVAR